MTNPYQSYEAYDGHDIRASLQGPAISLIVVAIIAIAVGMIALGVDVLLLASGAVERLEEMNRGGISKYTQILIRSVWGVILMIASVFVLYGGIQMKNLRNYGVARTAAIVACIPLLGPCCLLGIPFGIWAFIALGKPGVEAAFTR